MTKLDWTSPTERTWDRFSCYQCERIFYLAPRRTGLWTSGLCHICEGKA